MVPADKRPTPEELIGYEQRYESDPDYNGVRRERAIWMFDYRKETEDQNRDSAAGRTPLEGHEPISRGNASGFDPDTFNLDEVVRRVGERGSH